MRKHTQRGFTLVEVVIVVVIVIILTSISLVYVYEARQQSRDARRIADLEQLELALNLYRDQFRSWPDCGGGIQLETGGQSLPDTGGSCGDGAQLLTFLSDHMKEMPHDPLGPGNVDYYYYYDSNHSCTGVGDGNISMVFAVNLESLPSNVIDVCGTHLGNDGGYLDTTSTALSGSISSSQPFVIILDEDS